MLSTVRTVRLRPLPGRLAVVPIVSIFLISFFNPLFDYLFCFNSFRNFLALFCLFCLKNFIEILSSSLNPIFLNNLLAEMIKSEWQLIHDQYFPSIKTVSQAYYL